MNKEDFERAVTLMIQQYGESQWEGRFLTEIFLYERPSAETMKFLIVGILSNEITQQVHFPRPLEEQLREVCEKNDWKFRWNLATNVIHITPKLQSCRYVERYELIPEPILVRNGEMPEIAGTYRKILAKS